MFLSWPLELDSWLGDAQNASQHRGVGVGLCVRCRSDVVPGIRTECYITMAGYTLPLPLPVLCFLFLISGNSDPLGASFVLSFLAAENDKDQEAKNMMLPRASMWELPGQWFGGLFEWWELSEKPQWIWGCPWPGANCVPVPWTAYYFLRGSTARNCEWVLSACCNHRHRVLRGLFLLCLQELGSLCLPGFSVQDGTIQKEQRSRFCGRETVGLKWRYYGNAMSLGS